MAHPLALARALALSLLFVLAAAVPAGAVTTGWTTTGSLAQERRAHTAVELRDGRVLVISGFATGVGEVPSAELYDPATGTWSLAAPLLVPRHYATATLLLDGRVLLAGGYTAGGVTTHAELYDPVADSWTATGALTHPRNGHRATRLADGRVLVVGGADGARNGQPVAERYDPATGTWSPTPPMSFGAENLQLQPLADGRILVAGGVQLNPGTTFYATAQLYDPGTNTWHAAPTLNSARAQGAVVQLADGRVAVIGGVATSGYVNNLEVWSPGGGSGWTTVPSLQPGAGNITDAVALGDETVLIVTDGGAPRLWDPAAGTMTPKPFAFPSVLLPSVTLLRSGKVLVAGGGGSAGQGTAAQLYAPPARRSTPATDFGTASTGTAVEREVTVTNPGGVPLEIAGVALSGADAAAFAIVATDCVTASPLAQGATCTVRVRFTAGPAGTANAELTFDDNAPGAPAGALIGRAVLPPVIDEPRPLPPVVQEPAPPVGTPRCADDYVVLAGVQLRGGKMQLTGIASASLVGRALTVQRNGKRAGSVTAKADGAFSITVPAPKGAAARANARYRVLLPGVAQSLSLKATRVASVSVRRAGGKTTARGRIAGVRKRSKLTVEARPSCGAGQVVKTTLRTDPRGRFRAVLAPPPAGHPALIYRIRMGAKTVTLPIIVAPRG